MAPLLNFDRRKTFLRAGKKKPARLLLSRFQSVGRLDAHAIVSGADLGIVSDKAHYLEEAVHRLKEKEACAARAKSYSIANKPLIERRRSFDLGELRLPSSRRPKATMFHELRSYFDPDYRLYLVKKEILRISRELGISIRDLFDMVDEDGTGVIDRTELRAMIHTLGVIVKDVEIETLMRTLDSDGSGEVSLSEFDEWLWDTSTTWLEGRRRRARDEFSDVRLLQRERLRWDPLVIRALDLMWHLVDHDGSGTVDMGEYVELNLNLQRAVVDDLDEAEARDIALREFEFDAQGEPSLDKRLFFWSFFQLADAWRETPDITAEAVADFMAFLVHRTTTPDGTTGARTWKWQEDPDHWHKKIVPMRIVESEPEKHFNRADEVFRLGPKKNHKDDVAAPPKKTRKKNDTTTNDQGGRRRSDDDEASKKRKPKKTGGAGPPTNPPPPPNKPGKKTTEKTSAVVGPMADTADGPSAATTPKKLTEAEQTAMSAVLRAGAGSSEDPAAPSAAWGVLKEDGADPTHGMNHGETRRVSVALSSEADAPPPSRDSSFGRTRVAWNDEDASVLKHVLHITVSTTTAPIDDHAEPRVDGGGGSWGSAAAPLEDDDDDDDDRGGENAVASPLKKKKKMMMMMMMMKKKQQQQQQRDPSSSSKKKRGTWRHRDNPTGPPPRHFSTSGGGASSSLEGAYYVSSRRSRFPPQGGAKIGTGAYCTSLGPKWEPPRVLERPASFGRKQVERLPFYPHSGATFVHDLRATIASSPTKYDREAFCKTTKDRPPAPRSVSLSDEDDENKVILDDDDDNNNEASRQRRGSAPRDPVTRHIYAPERVVYFSERPNGPCQRPPPSRPSSACSWQYSEHPNASSFGGGGGGGATTPRAAAVLPFHRAIFSSAPVFDTHDDESARTGPRRRTPLATRGNAARPQSAHASSSPAAARREVPNRALDADLISKRRRHQQRPSSAPERRATRGGFVGDVRMKTKNRPVFTAVY